MMHFKRNILIILMIVVNCMSFKTDLRPTNEDFKMCTDKILDLFPELKDIDDLFKEDSTLMCVKYAIMYISENQPRANKIKDPKEFCNEVTKDKPESAAEFLNCVLALVKFGNTREKIMENAIKEYRTRILYEEAFYIFHKISYESQYLKDISDGVTLKDNHELDTPGMYCVKKCPDYPDEASTSNRCQIF